MRRGGRAVHSAMDVEEFPRLRRCRAIQGAQPTAHLLAAVGHHLVIEWRRVVDQIEQPLPPLPLVAATGTALDCAAEKKPMGHAARQEQDPLLSARQALEEGRGFDGANAIRQAVAVSASAPTYDQALRLAVEFNLVSLARELAEAAVNRYPRDAKLRRWAKVLAPPVVREYTGPRISSVERDKDIAWLRAHADEYRGMWVVLSGGELLAAGKRDIRRALRRIRRRTSAPLFIHSLRE